MNNIDTMKKKLLVYIGILIGFLVLSYAFVPQVLGGKIVNQSDISGWQGMAHEMHTWNSAHPGDKTAWTESMFGGMPTTTIQTPSEGDWTLGIYNLLLKGKRPATYLFISLVGAFLLLLSLGVNPLIAAGGAVAVTFCSYNFQIIQVGHNTKMQALAFLPWVLAAVVYTYNKAIKGKKGGWLAKTFLGAAGFGLFLSFQIKAYHPQISFYLALMILLYALVLFIHLSLSKERRKSYGQFFAASALLLLLGCVGIGTNAIKLLPTLEYKPYSMRGGSTADADGNKANKGLDLDYATSWSYGWEELPNLLIPNYNGGSSAGAVNPDKSETYALLKQAGQSNLKEISKNLPLYWGPQPFTAGPMYLGAVTIFLFIFGLIYYRGKERWWALAATLIAVFLAVGYHFIAFTKFFYNFVPMYNSFRTVSMALVILQFTLPVLGFLMLDNIARSSENNAVLRRRILVAGAVSIGLCLLLALGMSMFGSFTGSSDKSQPQVLVDALSADRHQLLWADCWRSILFIAVAVLLLLWGLSDKSRRVASALLVCVLVLADLFAAGKRYLNDDDFITPKKFQSQFDKRKVDEMILMDNDPSYRVLDLTVDVFNSSRPSYWHKNIGGYSPAKLQRYQEFIDSHLISEINTLYSSISGASTVQEAEDSLPYLPGLAEMNTRYIIIGDELPPLRYRYAKGNAWFEEGDDDEITLTSYAPNELHYSYSSQTGGKAVFSEVFYPAGWTLKTENGDELAIDVYDGVLRSAVLPSGEHELVMRFDPQSYVRGARISRSCSLLIFLLAAASIALSFIKKEFAV